MKAWRLVCSDSRPCLEYGLLRCVACARAPLRRGPKKASDDLAVCHRENPSIVACAACRVWRVPLRHSCDRLCGMHRTSGQSSIGLRICFLFPCWFWGNLSLLEGLSKWKDSSILRRVETGKSHAKHFAQSPRRSRRELDRATDPSNAGDRVFLALFW